MRQPIIGSSPNWPRKSRDAPCVWFDRAGRNQLVVTRCGPLRSRFRSDPVGMSRCPHAAAPPSSVMNSRRRMCALKSRDRTYHIVDAKNALCVTAKLIGQCRRWVKNGNTHREHMFSALPPTTDIQPNARRSRNHRPACHRDQRPALRRMVPRLGEG